MQRACAPTLMLIAAAVAVPSPAPAQRGDQDVAYREARAGMIRPLGEIIARVNIQVRGQYMGADFDPERREYRLKYMRPDSSVVWVDVDARNGRILRMTGE